MALNPVGEDLANLMYKENADFDFIGMGWGCTVCISNKLPDGIGVAGP